MCDLAFVNFLREKVRNQEAEERRTAIFGITPPRHFVPWIVPKQPQAVPPEMKRSGYRPTE